MQAFRSQLPQDAAEYVRLNVLPRPGPQPQPPPQIIGRPDDVERLLDEAGQRAQEVERGAAQAIEETAAVAAEEGEVAEGVRTHGGRGCWSDGCHGGSWRSGNGRVGRGTRRRRSLRPGSRHGLGAGEHALPASAGQRGRGRAGRPVRQQHERRHAAPALHAAHRQQHFGQPRKQPRLLAVWLPSPGADQSHAPPFSWGLNPVTLPQSQPNSRASSRSSGQSRQSRLPPPSYDQLARDIEAA